MQNRPSKTVDQIVSSYLEAMETNSRFADWQVKQAADAILLYADKYLKPKSSLPSSNGSIESKPMGPNNGRNSADWKEIFNKLLVVHSVSGMVLRHHVQPSTLQRIVKEAIRKSEISKPSSCHTLRHYAELGIRDTVSQPISWKQALTSIIFNSF